MIIKTVPGTSAFINTDNVETHQLGIAVTLYVTPQLPPPFTGNGWLASKVAILITIHKDYIFLPFISTVPTAVPRINVNFTHRVDFQWSSPALSRDRPSLVSVSTA